MRTAKPTPAQQRQLDTLKAACEARKNAPNLAITDTDFDFEVIAPVVHSTESFELSGWAE